MESRKRTAGFPSMVTGNRRNRHQQEIRKSAGPEAIEFAFLLWRIDRFGSWKAAPAVLSTFD
jgi:hypothetical protein